MSLRMSHEDLVNRALMGLFLSFRPKLTQAAAELLGVRADLGGVKLDYVAMGQRFSPDVVLRRDGCTEIEVVIETKLSANAQATSLETVAAFSQREGDQAAMVHAAVADPRYGVKGGKRDAEGLPPDGVWQIDAYFAWKWWEKELPDFVLAPGVEFIYLSLEDGAAAEKFTGAASADYWRSVNLVDLVMGLNRELRRESVEELAPDAAHLFTQDEKDAIAVLTFLVYTHIGGDHVSPHRWVSAHLGDEPCDPTA